MCKISAGHVAFSPDGRPEHSLPAPHTHLDHFVATEDDSLDTKDEENNQFQQTILNLYFVENRKPKLSESETLPRGSQLYEDESGVGECVEPVQAPCRPSRVTDNLVEHEMELIQFEENNLSREMTILEHRIREAESEGEESEELLSAWFELISKKNVIFHRRLMIEILQEEQDLERRCQILQAELRRQELDQETEHLLLEKLLRIVDLRDKCVSDKIDEEEFLHQEELIGKEVQFCKVRKSSGCVIQ